MPSIVALSFCCMIVAGALGLEWANVGNGEFAFAAVAAVLIFSACDAWLSEDRPDRPEAFNGSSRGVNRQDSVPSELTIR
jgi:hypothetical protein